MTKRITDHEVLDIIEKQNPLSVEVSPNKWLDNGTISQSRQEIYSLLCNNKNLTRATCWLLFALHKDLEKLKK